MQGRQDRTPYPLISGNVQHAHAERGLDLYETPDVAVNALLKHEIVPFTIWEPCCGPGSIVRVMRDRGRGVIASDIADYGCPDSVSGIDFLESHEPPPGVHCVVTNPPYKYASAFIDHATDLCPHVCMLLRLEYLAADHRGLLDRKPPARIYAFKQRLPMMHRHGWDGPRTITSRFNFAWYVWDHNAPRYQNTRLYRIGWKDENSTVDKTSSPSEGSEKAPVG